MICANGAMAGSYDYGEVARSVLIAIAASYSALDLAGRVTAAKDEARLFWLSGGAAAMGIGIWAMHVKGMLAFRLPVAVEYDWPTLLASLVVAIFASAVALSVASRQKMSAAEALTGSVMMGGGIAGLHYIGMAAMRLPAVTRYSPLLVTLSILLAVLFSLIALLMAFDLREETRWTVPRRLGSAIVMGVAVSAMHYTGMAAASFNPASHPNLSHAVSISTVGNNAIAVVTSMVLMAALVTSSVDRRTSAEVEQMNQASERRVAERTLQLEAVNRALRKEIAERERAEVSLRRSEDRLRLVIDTIPHQIWSGSPDGSIDFCNFQWLSYMGFTLEEVQGEGWQRMLHPEDRERVLKAWRESVANGTPYEQEERHRRLDEQYRWFLSRGVPLRDSEGRIARWYGTNTDIEDRKRAEDELRKQKEVLQKIFGHLPVMIGFVGADGHIELVNSEWQRTMGWTLKEIREQNLDIFAEAYPDLQDRQMVVDPVAASTGAWTDLRVRVKDGRVIDLSVAVVHLSDGSSVAIGRDITERKRAEEALRDSEAALARVTRAATLGELTTSIAHEINQPLAAIVTDVSASLRWLAQEPPNLEEARAGLAVAIREANRASDVIGRIRALLRNTPSPMQRLDVKEVILNVLTMARLEFQGHGITVKTELDSNIPPVISDPIQLQQLLLNLILNAIDAMNTIHDRPRELLLKAEPHAEGVLIQVQDTGIGLDPARADRIFEPFFTTKPQGIGLGLSISRSIVEAHGGRLWASRNSPYGAVFQFTLQQAEDQHA